MELRGRKANGSDWYGSWFPDILNITARFLTNWLDDVITSLTWRVCLCRHEDGWRYASMVRYHSNTAACSSYNFGQLHNKVYFTCLFWDRAAYHLHTDVVLYVQVGVYKRQCARLRQKYSSCETEHESDCSFDVLMHLCTLFHLRTIWEKLVKSKIPVKILQHTVSKAVCKSRITYVTAFQSRYCTVCRSASRWGPVVVLFSLKYLSSDRIPQIRVWLLRSSSKLDTISPEMIFVLISSIK